MAEFVFKDSAHKFTAPVRKFKANDPYYYEVDNLPLGELEQNDLFLLDQLTGIQLTGVSRRDLDELKPYATGGDQTVRVKPGRFIARINDAYGKQYKQLSDPQFQPTPGSLFNGYYFGEGGQWITATAALQLVSDNIEKIKGTDLQKPLSLHGLMERLLGWSQNNSRFGYDASTYVTPPTLSILSDPGSPGFDGNYQPVWNDIVTQFTTDSLQDLEWLAIEFTRKWGGAVRTALVDVAEELSVVVPPFNGDDFYYINEDGTHVSIDPTNATRIDLLFVYSVPADTSSTWVLGPNTKERLTTPKLGLAVGAGLAADFEFVDQGSPPGSTGFVGVTKTGRTDSIKSSLDVKAFMLPDIADSHAQTGGFITDDGARIFGSMPSPDDMMNISPLLFNGLESNDVRLIGQTVLPVAYIVRKAGSVTVDPLEVIDIRPFLRTTELTYNERAGIAGAGPPISFANPVVGKKELQKHFKDFKANVVDQIEAPDGNAIWEGDGANFPRPIGGGIIWGGTKWGPEGAITQAKNDGGAWMADGPWGGGAYANVPLLPDWDLATWLAINESSYTEAGLHRNDYINYKITANSNLLSTFGGGTNQRADLDFSDNDITGNNWGKNAGTGLPFNFIGCNQTANRNDNYNSKFTPFNMFWISKKINYVMPAGQWSDYDVKVNFLNCLPVVTPGDGDPYQDYYQQIMPAMAQGYWIEKGNGYFIINIAFSGPHSGLGQNFWKNHEMDPTTGKTQGLGVAGLGQEGTQINEPPWSSEVGIYNSRNHTWFRRFAVPTSTNLLPSVQIGNNIADTNDKDKPKTWISAKNVSVNQVGSCTYPTVQFEVMGYPSSWQTGGWKTQWNKTGPGEEGTLAFK